MGFVTITEGVDWARLHPEAVANPTPDNRLCLCASKLNFGNVSVDDFPEGENAETPQNLFSITNFLTSSFSGKIRGSVNALGRVNLKLPDKSKGTVQIVNDAATVYDWNGGDGEKCVYSSRVMAYGFA